MRPEFARTGGHHLGDGQEADPVGDDADLVGRPHGVERWALDPELAERPWQRSADLVARSA